MINGRRVGGEGFANNVMRISWVHRAPGLLGRDRIIENTQKRVKKRENKNSSAEPFGPADTPAYHVLAIFPLD